jgi:hypothetical protein
MFVCGLLVLIAIAVAASASEGYVRFSCGGHGISSTLTATNGQGETLVVWQDGQQSGGGYCESTVADAAVGSASTGFASLGTISSPNELSYATGVSLDGTGDGWVIGLHEVYAGSNKYGPDFEKSGVWAAFRPAGGGFRAPVELPIKGRAMQETEAWVAGNRAGKTLLAWSTDAGAYVAFGTSTGAVSKPTFIGGGFHIAGLGVDESGRALVVGYYYAKEADEVVRIATVTAGTSGSFSGPHILIRRLRNSRKRLIGYFEPPLVAIGPHGNAVIAWKTIWENRHGGDEFPGPSLLLYRQASGRFEKPVRLPGGFLESEDAAAVDGAGRAIMVSPTTNYLQEIAVSPDDRVGRPHRLWSYVGYPEVASNAQGQAVVAWGGFIPFVYGVLGNTRGKDGKPQTITSSPSLGDTISAVTPTMSPQGVATVFWVEQPKKEETILYARAVAAGAQPVKVASGEPAAS